MSARLRLASRARGHRRGAALVAALVGVAMLVAACSAVAMPGKSAATASLMPAAAAAAVKSMPTQPLPTVTRNVPFAEPVGCSTADCSVLMDIWVPSGPGPFQTVVLVRGGPTGAGGRGYLDPFAAELAEQGLIVFNADMRDIATQGGGYPEAFQDVACAIRYAHLWSPYYAGDGSVTLVGHSLGGFVGSVVALGAEEFTGGCLATGSGRPEAFVGLSGNYNLDDPHVAKDLTVFYGGSPEEESDYRLMSDPFTSVGATQIPTYLVAGTADTTVNPQATLSLGAHLTEEGWPVALTFIEDATHNSIIVPGQNGPDSMAVVLQATNSVARG
jgi:pimeloyl-ACP methyl ester carboxylesterase